jgi:tetratricopeptide (TPR) repeat protein
LVRGRDLDRLLVSLAEDSEQGARLRTLAGAGAAGLLLVVGALAASGEGAAAVALAAAALVAAALVAGLHLKRGGRLAVRRRTEEDAPTMERWPLRAEATPPAARASRTPRASLVTEPSRAAVAWLRTALRPYARAAGRRLSRLLRRVQRLIGQAALDAGLPASSTRDDERLAGHLARDRSALGIELRRVGEPAQAAEQHRTARALYAAAGNRRGEALASNSLALALVDSGDPEAALQEFERARALLHALGDDEHEAKVLVNIGVVKQRAGARDEAAEALASALRKLPPQTPAYRLVERQLRKAS